MKIGEIEVGAEYRYDKGSGYYVGRPGTRRVRVDAIEKVEETTRSWRGTSVRNVRKLKVTELDRDTGQPLDQSPNTYTNDHVLAKDVLSAWEDYREKHEASQERSRRLQLVDEAVTRVEEYAGVTIHVRRHNGLDKGRDVTLTLSFDDADELAKAVLQS